MTILLLLASMFAAAATVLGARLLNLRQAHTARALTRIDDYGFTALGERNEAAPDLLPALTARLGRMLPAGLRRSEDDVRATLVGAGLYRTTPAQYFGYRALSVVLAAAVWLWAWWALALTPLLGIALGFVMVGSAWLLPEAELKRRRADRLDRIDRGLPDLVDFLVVTVEAGIGFPAALQAAAGRFPAPLGDELRLAAQEQRMGLSIEESLRNLLARANTPGMSSFVRSVVQAETLGVSMGQILRSLATEMRRRRRQAAEERAQKAPIKMLFPLAFLIFPSLFLIVLGPAVYELMKTLGGH